MASILRSIVAGPRQRHPDAGLDLCYVTDNIVVTSGPSSTYPARAYRNPTEELVRWLDDKHGKEWMIWEFRAEGTGYPDSEVYGRVHHYPWPDHHPPPFHLIPAIMAGMRNWLHEDGAKEKGRTVVVHCKAGKGRSGTVATSYLISQEGWSIQDALNRFTQRRMRPGFGAGVSIPSQIRWVGYVDRWTKGGRRYIESKAVVKEVHVWGLREGVKVSVDGFFEEGRKIKPVHTFGRNERLIVDGSTQNGSLLADIASSGAENEAQPSEILEKRGTDLIDTSGTEPDSAATDKVGSESGGKAVIFRASEPIVLETSDVCIDFERRNHAKYGWTMVTSVAHVWFNVYFEGLFQQEKADVMRPPSSGVFNIEWDAMDGIKGTSRKGTRAFDRLAVVWEVSKPGKDKPELVVQPKMGETVPGNKPTNWRGDEAGGSEIVQKDLGMRVESPSSANISKANSVRSVDNQRRQGHGQGGPVSTDDSGFEGIQAHGPSRYADVDDAGIDKNDGAKRGSIMESVRVATGYLGKDKS